MGVIRVLLATAVALQHVGSLYGLTMTGSVVSVETFYIVSGFYMALILSEKYTGKASYGLFISNRFLKIFPIYWGVLLLTLLISFVFLVTSGKGLLLQPYRTEFSALSLPARSFLLLVNTIVFGQDAVMFMTSSANGQLTFTPNFWDSDPKLFNFLLVPQAWTLALELMFYLLAPYLVRRKTELLIVLGMLSLGVRAYTYKVLGWNNDPWTYRFFPSELMFFLAGMVSYRLYVRSRASIPFKHGVAAWAAVILAIGTYQFIPGGSLKMGAFFLLVTLALPLIFSATGRMSADRTLGEMSYPIYLSHLLVFAVISELPWMRLHLSTMRIVTLACTSGLSFILVQYIGRPLEEFRQRRVTVTSA